MNMFTMNVTGFFQSGKKIEPKIKIELGRDDDGRMVYKMYFKNKPVIKEMISELLNLLDGGSNGKKPKGNDSE